MLCFNLFIAVISYSFGQIQEDKAAKEADEKSDSESESDSDESPDGTPDEEFQGKELQDSSPDRKPSLGDVAMEEDAKSEEGTGKGAGGVINSGFSNAQRLKLRTQGASAFLTSSNNSSNEPEKELTHAEKKQFKKAQKGQDEIRRYSVNLTLY